MHYLLKVKNGILLALQYKKKSWCDGNVLLELALAIPAILAIVVGIMECAHVVQVKNALDKGVETALRCLYPVNGRCIKVDGKTPLALYDWYKESVKVKYEVDTYNYFGLGRWFEMPRYVYEASAKIPDAVSAYYSQTNYSAKKVSYAVNGTLDYWIETTRSPYAKGVNINNSMDFVYEGTRGVTYEPIVSMDLTGISLDYSGNKSASVKFKVPRPWESINPVIFKANEYDKPGTSHTANFSIDKSGDYLTTAPIKIFVAGTGGIGTATGKVTMSLSWNGGGPLDLGGRGFTEEKVATAQNFVPRGFPPRAENGVSYYDSALMKSTDGGTYTEWEKYEEGKVNLPWDRTATLTLSIERTAGTGAFTWTGRVLNVFIPKFEHAQPYTQRCGWVSRADYNKDGGQVALTDCGLSLPPNGLKYLPTTKWIDTTQNIDVSEPIWLGCHVKKDGMVGTAQAFFGTEINGYDIYTTTDSCPFYTISNSCPAFGKTGSSGVANFGVRDEPSGQNILTNSASAASVCPAPTDAKTSGLTPVSTQWHESTVSVPAPDNPNSRYQFLWTKTGCNQSPTVPDYLLQIPANKRTLTPVNIQGYEKVFTGTQDPNDMKATSPAIYNCSDIKVVERAFDSKQNPPLSSSSLFVGAKQDLGDLCYKDLLHADAISNGLDKNAYFSVLPPPQQVSSVILDTPPGGDCGVAFKLSAQPSQEYVNEPPTKVASGLPEGSVPLECKSSSAICRKELVGYQGGGSSAAIVNKELARQEAFAAISAMYPNAKVCALFDASCNEASAPADNNCIDVCVKQTSEKGNVTYKAYSTSRVPLFTKQTSVSTFAQEESERNFAR